MRNQKELIESEFSRLGFSILFYNETPTSKGVDCVVQKGKSRPLNVEIKTIKINKKAKSCSVKPIGRLRAKDDLIAIIINSKYVLIEPMKDHLKSCGPKGHRPLSLLYSGNYK